MRPETQRYHAAAQKVLDGLDPQQDLGEIMVAMEGAVATVLLAVMGRDAEKAVAMLNEGLVPGVEERIAKWANRDDED